MNKNFQNEHALLQQLRRSGNPASLRNADQLQRLYHDRHMALLSTDVYNDAKGAGTPPPGWARVSEHPELVRQIASQLHTSSDQLQDMLKPDTSGFRAEIYLPDPAVLGPGYKPTAAFKGSSGEVLTSSGLRDTTQEDFLANNFPQSIGLETDYYNRAMRLAWQLQSNGMHVEYTGHSLGGGLASAASAISGEPATTFNAAGLHPLTAQRFAEQNGLPVYDVHHRITAYHVQNELLNDGVQNNFHTLDEARCAQVGQVIGTAAHLLHEMPAVRDRLAHKLNENMPEYAQASVNAFIDRLAAGDTAQMLRELPLAAGTQQPTLPAMQWGQHQPVPRQDAMTLQETTLLAKPLLEVASSAERGMETGVHVGKKLGVAADDLFLAAALQSSGAPLGLPDPVITRAVEERLHRTPAQKAVDHHPTLTAAVSGAAGAVAAFGSASEQFSPDILHLGRTLRNMADTRKVLTQGGATASEAVERHVMLTVLPSLDARIQESEWMARLTLPRTVQAPATSHVVRPDAGHAAPQLPGNALHEQNGKIPQIDLSQRLDRMLKAAEAGDWVSFLKDNDVLAEMAPGRRLQTHVTAMVDMQERHAAELAEQRQAVEQQMQQQMQQRQSHHPSHGMSR